MDSDPTRRRALVRASKQCGSIPIIRRLNLIRNYQHGQSKQILTADIESLKERYRKDISKRTTKSLTYRKSRSPDDEDYSDSEQDEVPVRGLVSSEDSPQGVPVKGHKSSEDSPQGVPNTIDICIENTHSPPVALRPDCMVLNNEVLLMHSSPRDLPSKCKHVLHSYDLEGWATVCSPQPELHIYVHHSNFGRDYAKEYGEDHIYVWRYETKPGRSNDHNLYAWRYVSQQSEATEYDWQPSDAFSGIEICPIVMGKYPDSDRKDEYETESKRQGMCISVPLDPSQLGTQELNNYLEAIGVWAPSDRVDYKVLKQTADIHTSMFRKPLESDSDDAIDLPESDSEGDTLELLEGDDWYIPISLEEPNTDLDHSSNILEKIRDSRNLWLAKRVIESKRPQHLDDWLAYLAPTFDDALTDYIIEKIDEGIGSKSVSDDNLAKIAQSGNARVFRQAAERAKPFTMFSDELQSFIEACASDKSGLILNAIIDTKLFDDLLRRKIHSSSIVTVAKANHTRAVRYLISLATLEHRDIVKLLAEDLSSQVVYAILESTDNKLLAFTDTEIASLRPMIKYGLAAFYSAKSKEYAKLAVKYA